MELYVGRYVLGPVLGRGGTCAVYRAWDPRLHRHVAIKRLEPPMSEDEHTRARFDREGRAIARLSHPNLVTLIDRGTSETEDYLVFEYVEGRSLRDLIKNTGPLEGRDAGQIAGQIASGLAHAHLNGIVHRDVKPQNILLDAEGRAKLTDFGIATGEEWTRVTREGSIVGSSRYMSPEQVQGRPVDRRSDIYSLGIVFYEMVTGVPPFQGQSLAEVGRQHVRAQPQPPSELVPNLSAGVERVILRCLEKLPENRFQSADELLGALVGLDMFRQAKAAGGLIGGLRRVQRSTKESGSESGVWVPPPGTQAPPPPESVAYIDIAPNVSTAESSTRRRAQVMRERRGRRRSGVSRRTVGIVGLLVVGLVAAWFLLARGPAAPDLVGGSLDLANTAAEDVGLRVEVVEQVLSLDDQPGTVLAQEPAAGERGGGGVIQLTVTREPIPVKVGTVDDYDPEGDDTERPELLEQLIDDNDTTGWVTELYRNADFGGLPKTGVGITFVLDAPATVMEVLSHSTGWLAEVQAVAGDGTVTPMGTLDGLQRQTLAFAQPVSSGRIWITRLAAGESDRFQVQLSEIRFYR
ncbi:MAG: protein kinase [Actinobacteria bacterium]|nr:protein kinase [Actinomycetota bacterium]